MRDQALLFGETALARGFVTREQLDAALAQQRAKAGVPLGAVMVNMGIITMPQATAIEKLNAVFRRQQEIRERGEDEEQSLSGLTLGGCLVLERLATGSMGTTYRAHHMRLDRDVVVKVLHPRMVAIEGNLERFAREARAAANLEHPAIVSVYDFDSDQGYHFIVMQYVKGQDLKQVVEGRGALGPRHGLWIGARVLEGLAHAHARQIVQSDIKPANLLITAEPRVKIADFGLVRILSHSTSEEVSVFGEIIGTPQYMSPEQAMGDEFDHRADLYSLGITLFELIAGRPPFTGNSTMEVLEKHIMEPMPSVKQFVPDASDDLEALLSKLCAKKQEDRYASAAAALADMQSMRFTGDGTTRRMASMEQSADPSRSGETPAIVTEAALNVLKDRLRTNAALIAMEGDDDDDDDDDDDLDNGAATSDALIEDSFSGVEVTSDSLAAARRRLVETQSDPERLVPEFLAALIKDGQNDEVLGLRRELETALPTSAAVAFYLGRAYDNKGRHEDARAKFALATVFSPDHLQARLHLARVLVALQRVDEAVATLREATTWHPTSLKAVVSLAEVLYVVKNDREAAVPAYEKAIELAPTRWQLRQQLAWILYELRRLDQSEAVLKEVTAWKKDSGPANKLLKKIQKRRRRLAKQRADAQASAAPTTKNAPPQEADDAVDVGATTLACLKRIRLATASGKWEKALSAAETGLADRPRSVSLLLAKAEALLHLERPSDAVSAYGLALTIDPDNERAHQGLIETQAYRRKSKRLKKKKKKKKKKKEP